MTKRTRKKFSRMRGSGTHGWGSKKKHRGAGSRGGRGKSGTGKKNESRKPSIWKDTKYFGKHGFKRPDGIKKKIVTINLIEVDKRVKELIRKKVVKKVENSFTLDLHELGYHKLLGNGRITEKIKIRVQFASQKAISKVKQAGGEVSLIKEEKEVEA